MGIGCLTLAPVALSKSYRNSTVQTFRSGRCWVLAALMLLYYLTASPAFYYAPVSEVALLIASAPLFAVVVRFAMREPVNRYEVFGTAMAIGGVAIMSYPGYAQAKTGSQHWIGVSLSITAAIAAALYAVGSRHLKDLGVSPGPVPQVLLTFTMGLVLLPFLAFEPSSTLGAPAMAWSIPLGAFSTALPTVAVAAAAHRVSAVVATLINPMCAICAGIVAAFALHELPSTWTLAGGALVVVAIYVAFRPVDPQASPE
jgi:drug/metabolite transporter (DMT)-like permease